MRLSEALRKLGPIPDRHCAETVKALFVSNRDRLSRPSTDRHETETAGALSMAIGRREQNDQEPRYRPWFVRHNWRQRKRCSRAIKNPCLVVDECAQTRPCPGKQMGQLSSRECAGKLACRGGAADIDFPDKEWGQPLFSKTTSLDDNATGAVVTASYDSLSFSVAAKLRWLLPAEFRLAEVMLR